MKIDVIEFSFTMESDVLVAYKRVKNLGQLAGLSLSDQVRFATAVTEIVRVCQYLFGKGNITFYVDLDNVEVIIYVINKSGDGSSIDLMQHLENSFSNGENMFNFRNLTDFFEIESSPDGLTKIILAKKTTPQKVLFRDTLQNWNKILNDIVIVSPYEEIKKTNTEFLKLYDGLKRNS